LTDLKTFDIQVNVSFDDFDEVAFLAALANSTGASSDAATILSVEYTVRSEYTFTEVVSEEEASSLLR